jgi:hypothetical protein
MQMAKDLLVAYNPEYISMADRSGPLETEISFGGRPADSADEYYASFAEGLRALSNIQSKEVTGGGRSSSVSAWSVAVLDLSDSEDDDELDNPNKTNPPISKERSVSADEDKIDLLGEMVAEKELSLEEFVREVPTALGAMDEWTQEEDATYEMVEGGDYPERFGCPVGGLDALDDVDVAPDDVDVAVAPDDVDVAVVPDDVAVAPNSILSQVICRDEIN